MTEKDNNLLIEDAAEENEVAEGEPQPLTRTDRTISPASAYLLKKRRAVEDYLEKKRYKEVYGEEFDPYLEELEV